MSTNLTLTTSVVSGDLFVLFKTSQGDYRGLAAANLLTYLNANLTFPGSKPVTQYAAPSATAFNVTITDGSDDDQDVHLILTPTAGFAAGTITLPAISSCIDKQEVIVNCTQAVTTLTVAPNGATAVTGEPSGLAANDFFTLKLDLPTSTWYRVG